MTRHTILRFATGAAFVLVAAVSLNAHDLFLRPARFFTQPGTTVAIDVLNGSLGRSENSVARDRVRDISIVGPASWLRLDTTVWSAAGDTSRLDVSLPRPGTYLVGASLLPRRIDLSASDFNEYLRHDGLPDVLEARRRQGELGKDARERYSKHVKTLIQSGNGLAGNIGEVLGYPAELVPLDNPYRLRGSGWLRVRALVDGQPVANQFVVAGRVTRSGSVTERGIRTAADGTARVRIDAPGTWYVKFIHMVPVPGEADLDYESKWATLTFAVR